MRGNLVWGINTFVTSKACLTKGLGLSQEWSLKRGYHFTYECKFVVSLSPHWSHYGGAVMPVVHKPLQR